MERPDLSNVSPEVVAYIEHLELAALAKQSSKPRTAEPVQPDEPPTTINLISISKNGVAKRTPRHHYGRQRRGGMGVFDIDIAEPDYPAILALADEADDLLLFTNLGRAYRLSVDKVEETAVRAKGNTLMHSFKFQMNERIVAVLPAEGGVYICLVSERGWVQRVRSSHFGRSLIPGMQFHDPSRSGEVTAACWTMGEEHVFIGTKQGKGIRFRETQIPAKHGCLGLRLDEGDETVAITAVTDDGSVFLLSHDGKGTIRQMSGFRMNQAPGAGTKVALKTDNMVGAVTVKPNSDLFIISETGKLIRFDASEVPPKTGTVQGVNCINLRNDVATAVTI